MLSARTEIEQEARLSLANLSTYLCNMQCFIPEQYFRSNAR